MTDAIYSTPASDPPLSSPSTLTNMSPQTQTQLHIQKYTSDYRDTSENKAPLPPHIFQLTNNAYYHMSHTAQDQSLMIQYGPVFLTSCIVYEYCILL